MTERSRQRSRNRDDDNRRNSKRRGRDDDSRGKRRSSSPSFGKRFREAQKPYSKSPFLEVSQGVYGIKVNEVKYVEGRSEDFWIVEGTIKFGRSKSGYSEIKPDQPFRKLGAGDNFCWLVKLSLDAGPGDAKQFVATASGEEFEETSERMIKGACSKKNPLRGTYLSARVTEVETQKGGIFTAVDWELIGDAEDFEAWKDEQPSSARRKKKKRPAKRAESERPKKRKRRDTEDDEEPRRKKKRPAKKRKRFS